MAAITSYDQILSLLDAGGGQELFFQKTLVSAHATGGYHTSWANTGNPGVGSWAGSGGAATATMVNSDSTTVGALPLVSPTTVSGNNPRILTAGVMGSASMGGTLMLIDRLADTGALTTTFGGACTITMPGGGWARYTNGVGVMAFVESLELATPSASTTISLNYTNPVPTATRTSGSATIVATKSRVFGTSGPFLTLQAGDTGIKSIESINVGAVTPAANSLAVVVCKPLLVIPCTTAYYYTERDLVIQTPKLPKLVVAADATACLQWIYFSGTTTAIGTTFSGSVSTVTG